MAWHRRILRALGNGPARRNLFGPVDREQLQLEYSATLRKDLEEASRRWSFDFASERPLEGGDFRWVGVSGVRVPVLYRCLQGKENGHTPERFSPAHIPERFSPAHIPERFSPAHTPERFSPVPLDTERTPEKRAELKRKQTNITDFYQAKKRQVATPRKSGQ